MYFMELLHLSMVRYCHFGVSPVNYSELKWIFFLVETIFKILDRYGLIPDRIQGISACGYSIKP